MILRLRSRCEVLTVRLLGGMTSDLLDFVAGQRRLTAGVILDNDCRQNRPKQRGGIERLSTETIAHAAS